MKVSLNWIKDYVKLPEDMDLTRLAYDLTMSTVEVEGAEDLAKRFEHMLVGVVTEVCPHPNADKLRICKTDIGGGDIREIVCGGTNLTAGSCRRACSACILNHVKCMRAYLLGYHSLVVIKRFHNKGHNLLCPLLCTADYTDIEHIVVIIRLYCHQLLQVAQLQGRLHFL